MKKHTFLLVFVCVALVIGFFGVRAINQKRAKENALTHFAAADQHQRNGRTEDAIHEMKLAIEADPAYLEARQGLADIHESEGQLPEAIAVLEEGVKKAPKDREKYLILISDIYAGKKEYAKAIDHLKQALEIEPDNVLGRRQLAMWYESSKRWDEAEAAWQDFQKRYPNETSGKRGLERVKRLRKETALAEAKPNEKTTAEKPELTAPEGIAPATKQPR